MYFVIFLGFKKIVWLLTGLHDFPVIGDVLYLSWNKAAAPGHVVLIVYAFLLKKQVLL